MVVVDLPDTANGTTALTCPAETYNSGAGVPSKVTVRPPSDVATLPVASSVTPAGIAGPISSPKR